MHKYVFVTINYVPFTLCSDNKNGGSHRWHLLDGPLPLLLSVVRALFLLVLYETLKMSYEEGSSPSNNHFQLHNEMHDKADEVHHMESFEANGQTTKKNT